jgi:O-antigen ligase
VERFRTFKAPPGEQEAIERGDFVTQHLLSGSGSGRWQFWTAAVDEWREAPVLGEGAGSYEAWWAEHRSITLFVKDAHSLYLESLGELGVVGLGLVLALFASGIGIGVLRARRSVGDVRVTAAALAAVFAAYSAAAGFDWVWELTAVSVLGFAALAVVSASAAAAPAPLRPVATGVRPRRIRGRFGLGVAALLVAWILIFAQAIPLLAEREIADSEAAVEQYDLDQAFSSAGAARDIQPWAATPYLQLALVSEQAGDLPLARAWIDEAIERDRRDWRLWLVSARVETKLGRVAAAEQSLRRAAELNPRSPLFRRLLGES